MNVILLIWIVFGPFLIQLFVLLLPFALIGLPSLYLCKVLFPRITKEHYNFIFAIVVVQAALLGFIIFLSRDLPAPGLFKPILFVSKHSESLSLTLLEFFLQDNGFYRFTVQYVNYIVYFVICSIAFTVVIFSTCKEINWYKRISLAFFQGSTTSLLIFCYFSAFVSLPYLHSIDMDFDPVNKNKKVEFTKTDTREEKLGKMLFYPSKVSCPELVEILLKHGANSNSFDREGTPALFAASTGNNSYGDREEVIRLLLEAGADINTQDKKGTTFVMFVYSNTIMPMHEKKQVVLSLIQKGANIQTLNNAGVSLLSLALRRKDFEFADELIDLGCSMNKSTLKKIISGEVIISTTIPGTTKIFINAAENEDMQTLEYMLKNGFDINSRDRRGYTALKYATLKYNKKVIAFLLDHQADPDRTDLIKIAVLKSDIEFVEFLLKKGVPLDNEMKIAVKNNNKAMIKLLLDYETAPNL